MSTDLYNPVCILERNKVYSLSQYVLPDGTTRQSPRFYAIIIYTSKIQHNFTK